MKLIKYLGYLTLLLVINSCSFYSLKGTIPSHIKNVYIQPILNKSSDQDISDLINDKLNNLLISQNILEIVDYDTADSKIEITILEVSDLPYTLSKGNSFEKVNEWKFSVKIRAEWSDYKKGDIIFDLNLNEWGIYGDSLDISNDGIDNDGDGLIDSEDSDENGSPRDTAKLIAANKIAELILSKITSTW
ncbi:MAG: hypothetical protein CMG21_00900 [Candidatus Marinimicrobia bacterium]|nr:hypothetical protein [Candidatus Neomarinimicrobiota bacterium]|tara:strand:- start:33 stop:602 length:570 start_codon:yes stop_codon:yes gene_type:complete